MKITDIEQFKDWVALPPRTAIPARTPFAVTDFDSFTVYPEGVLAPYTSPTAPLVCYAPKPRIVADLMPDVPAGTLVEVEHDGKRFLAFKLQNGKWSDWSDLNGRRFGGHEITDPMLVHGYILEDSRWVGFQNDESDDDDIFEDDEGDWL